MKLFLDTNVLLDVLIPGREYNWFSSALMQVFKSGSIKACISTQSIIDASYVFSRCRKDEGLSSFKTMVDKLLSFIEIVSITDDDLREAGKSSVPDYEDACQLAAAMRIGCDGIVTSDGKFHNYTRLQVCTPQVLFDLIFE